MRKKVYPKLVKRTRNKGRLYKSMFLFLLLFIFNGYDSAHSQSCDPTITSVDNYQLGYRSREDRCEGFYRSEVGARSIEIVGLIKGNFGFKLDRKEVVEITSSVVTNSLINVRAVGIPIKTYYRMDAQITPSQKLVWPIGDVIYPQNLSSRKIGVFGWIEGQGHKTYVPISAEANLAPAVSDARIRLFVRTSVDVEVVKWRFSKVVNGDCVKFEKWNDTDSHKSLYRTGEPIRITLPSNLSGDLCFDIVAREKNRARWLKRSIRVIIEE